MGKPDSISDELITRIGTGDHDAFRTFFDIVYPTIYRFVHYFVSESEDCKEIVSEIFYIIWKQKDTLSSIQDIKSWLFILSRNEAYHFIKQREKYSHISIDDLPVDLQINPALTDNGIIEKEMYDIYNEAVAGLPERCKLIFLMVREEHLKYKEIAEILSITEGTVQQQMHIAVRKIVAEVEKHFPVAKR